MSARRPRLVIALIASIALLAGCAHQPAGPRAAARLQPLGFAIQAGAFARVDNAARFTNALEHKGLAAYYFHHPDGLYKVRFGNYPSWKDALLQARSLAAAGLIDDYYIVRPHRHNPGGHTPRSDRELRADLVQTARGFIGIPYRWGGTDAINGFDCSGLAMAVYRLNGLDLPRTSREQFRAGTKISRRRLRPGDLVFFATGRGHRVNHVGIYCGKNRFIQAPGRGKTIRTSSLGSDYYRKHYAGARAYLH